MPRKDDTKVSEKVLTKAVKRYMDGSATTESLAKEFGVSRATIYNWINQVRTRAMEEAAQAGMSEASLEKADKMTLSAELHHLRLENERLKKKLFDFMLKNGLL